MIRGPFASEPGRLEPILLGMRGLGKPGVHQVKWLEWNLFSEIYPMPYQGEALPVLPMRAEIVRPPRADIDMDGKMNQAHREEVLRQAERQKGRYSCRHSPSTYRSWRSCAKRQRSRAAVHPEVLGARRHPRRTCGVVGPVLLLRTGEGAVDKA
jgi:hypothetical protein